MGFIAFIAFIALVIIVAIILLFTSATTKEVEKPKEKRPVQNYKVRFEPANNKYFIVNELPTKDEPVVGFFGFRIFYDDKVAATFVTQKMNEKTK